MVVAIRANGDPLTLLPAARDAVHSIDRNLPLANVRTDGHSSSTRRSASANYR